MPRVRTLNNALFEAEGGGPQARVQRIEGGDEGEDADPNRGLRTAANGSMSTVGTKPIARTVHR